MAYSGLDVCATRSVNDKVAPDFEQLVKLLPPLRSCVPAAFNGALGRLLADARISPHSAKRGYQSGQSKPNCAHLCFHLLPRRVIGVRLPFRLLAHRRSGMLGLA